MSEELKLENAALRKRVEELEEAVKQLEHESDGYFSAAGAAEAKLARVRERAFSDGVLADDEWYTKTRAALGSIRCILAGTRKPLAVVDDIVMPRESEGE